MRKSIQKGQTLFLTIVSLSVTAAIVTALATYVVAEVGKHAKERNLVREKIALKNESYARFGKLAQGSNPAILFQAGTSQDAVLEGNSFRLIDKGTKVNEGVIRLSFSKEKSGYQASEYSYRLQGKYYVLDSFVKASATSFEYDGNSLLRVNG